MIVVEPDPSEALIIPVDKTRFRITYQSESESKVIICIEPKDAEQTDSKENP